VAHPRHFFYLPGIHYKKGKILINLILLLFDPAKSVVDAQSFSRYKLNSFKNTMLLQFPLSDICSYKVFPAAGAICHHLGALIKMF